MADEVLINRLYDIVDEITRLGGEQERTSIVPGVLVANANPSDLPTGYIKIVNPKDGGYVPCLTINGLVVADNDLLNVLFTKGTEPIALSQSSQSPSNSLKVSEVWESDFGAVALQADANGNIGIGATPTNRLTIQGLTGAGVTTEIFTGDGDGTDNANIVMYGVGTPGAITNRERLLIQYLQASSEWRIQSEADGTGTLRPLILETEGNDDQIYLATDGNVGIGSNSPNAKLFVGNVSLGVVGGFGLVISDSTANSQMRIGQSTGGRLLVRWNYNATAGSASASIYIPEGQPLRIQDTGGGKVAIGLSTPQGKIHAYDSISGFLMWEYDGLDATVRSIIPNGTGDVLYRLHADYVLRDSSGAVASGSTDVSNAASVNLTVGTNTVRLRVNADGSCDTNRTAGTDTIKVAYTLRWL